jgi:hypothetical protein
MNEDRRRILGMLAEGKITADEAERLITALERTGPPPGPAAPRVGRAPKYLRVEVDADEGDGRPKKVNIRVPINLLRAGVRLGALIPPKARDKINAAMARQGMGIDIDQLKPETIEALIEQLAEFTVDMDNERAKVRVFCE